MILRPDRQDFQGTAVTVDLARKLRVPKMLIVVNRVLQNSNAEEIQHHVEAEYKVPVAGVLPNCDEMMQLASSDLFCLQYANHPLTQVIRQIANQVMA